VRESLPLARDADGNVTGGIRTPWVEVPLGGHFPHSTPVPGRCEPAPHAPYADPAMLADLWAHLMPFPAAVTVTGTGTRPAWKPPRRRPSRKAGCWPRTCLSSLPAPARKRRTSGD